MMGNMSPCASALAAVITLGGSSSSAGMRSRPDEPQVVHKLIINKTALNGTESFEAIDKLYQDMATHVEMIIPGAKASLQEAEKM